MRRIKTQYPESSPGAMGSHLSPPPSPARPNAGGNTEGRTRPKRSEDSLDELRAFFPKKFEQHCTGFVRGSHL